MNTIIDITPIIEAVIGLVVVIITTFVIPYIKSKIAMTQWENFKDIAKTVVLCAEQTYRGSNLGKDKFLYCADELKKWCEKQGVTYNDEEIKQVIESAVKDMNDKLTDKG